MSTPSAQVVAKPNRLLAYRDADEYPAVVPVDVPGAEPDGLTLRPAWPLPFGGRRAGLLANSFEPQVVGLAQRLYTGWLTCDDVVRFAPHTSRRLTVPPNRASILLVNGLLARFGTAAANTVEPGRSPGGAGTT